MDLRTFTYIDVLQPQLASYISTVSQGFFPLEEQAALFVEVAPGMSINLVTDVVLKTADVTPGMLIVERQYGMLEVHSEDQGQVRAAGDAILRYYGIDVAERRAPVVRTHEIITGIEGYQAMILNRMRYGDLLLENEALYILECEPAGYAALAANEAEKVAEIHLLDVRTFGAFGRLYLGGDEESINQAANRVRQILEGTIGRAS
ncbi:MAG: hypothetical protein KC609_06655 [Myxococcales bacterium]|nr:hypothetical protein [Myxococcales bacterium]